MITDSSVLQCFTDLFASVTEGLGIPLTSMPVKRRSTLCKNEMEKRFSIKPNTLGEGQHTFFKGAARCGKPKKTFDLTTQKDLPDQCAFAVCATLEPKLSLRPTILKSSTYTDINSCQWEFKRGTPLSHISLLKFLAFLSSLLLLQFPRSLPIIPSPFACDWMLAFFFHLEDFKNVPALSCRRS